jgi:hypothetical protein
LPSSLGAKVGSASATDGAAAVVVEVDTNPLAGAGGPWLGILVGATAAAVRQGSAGGLLPRLNPLAEAGSFASASGERSPNEARGGEHRCLESDDRGETIVVLRSHLLQPA